MHIAIVPLYARSLVTCGPITIAVQLQYSKIQYMYYIPLQYHSSTSLVLSQYR